MRYHVRTALEFVTKSLLHKARCRSTKNASEKPLLLFDACKEKHVVAKWDYPWWYSEKGSGFPAKPWFPVQNHLLGWCLASCAYIFQRTFANTSDVSGQAGKPIQPQRLPSPPCSACRWTLSTTFTTRLEHGRVASAICHSHRSPVDLLHLRQQLKPNEIRIRCHRFARISNNE